MAEDYLESLSDEDIAALQQVLSNVSDIRLGSGSDSLKLATKTIDRVLKGAPGLPSDLILYQVYNGISEALRDGEEITENAFLTGTGVKPKEAGKDPVTVAIMLPKGTKALCLPDGGYVLARKQTLILKPTDEGDIPAIVKGWKSLTASGSWGYSASVQEFYNKNHGKGGRFSSGKSGGGGGSGTPDRLAAKTPAQKLARKNNLIAVAKSVALVVVVAGLYVGAQLIDSERMSRDWAKQRGFPPGGPQDKAARRGIKRDPKPGEYLYGKRDARRDARKERQRAAKELDGKRLVGRQKPQSANDWYNEMLQKPVIR